MEKLNIAELLKDCPKGMELDCTMWDNLYFDRVEKDLIHCYYESDGYRNTTFFCKNGCYTAHKVSKCVIFPKGKTTWKGFHRPFKDGDIIYVCDEYSDATFIYVAILKQIEKGGKIQAHCFYNFEDDCFCTHDFLYDGYNTRFATEEEKQKLFDAIKANGYKWNPETKTLEKLVEPKFKVGDRVLWNYDTEIPRTISKVQLTSKRGYVYWIECKGCSSGWWGETELTPIPNKFDIATLKPFDKVLTRVTTGDVWCNDLFGYYKDRWFHCGGHIATHYCIPYKGNEHLLGTTNDCDDFYKTWK